MTYNLYTPELYDAMVAKRAADAKRAAAGHRRRRDTDFADVYDVDNFQVGLV